MKRFLFIPLWVLISLIGSAQEKNNSWRENYFSGHPMHIGNAVQFLFDDYMVEDKYGLKRVAGPVEKHTGNPLDFGPFNPWELNPNLDGSYSMVRDPERKQWLLFRRPPTQALVREEKFYARRNTKRRVSVSLSEAVKHWTYPRNIVVLNELDDSKLTRTGNKMDIDWARVIQYEGVYFGLMDLMDNLIISVPRQSQLICSRDGFDRDRLPEHQSFIENGKPGEWDAGSVGRQSVVPDNDRIRIYYGLGGNTPQGYYGQEGEKEISRFRGTGLAFIGKNRFVGLQAGTERGYLLTRHFILDGKKVEINCLSQMKIPAPNLGSLIKAELLQAPDDHFAAIPYTGFSMNECDSITVKDAFHQTISWNGKSDLSSLQGKPVYIRFYIRNSNLYTFQVLKSHQ